jgi:hypothetical protein
MEEALLIVLLLLVSDKVRVLPVKLSMIEMGSIYDLPPPTPNIMRRTV